MSRWITGRCHAGMLVYIHVCIIGRKKGRIEKERVPHQAVIRFDCDFLFSFLCCCPNVPYSFVRLPTPFSCIYPLYLHAMVDALDSSYSSFSFFSPLVILLGLNDDLIRNRPLVVVVDVVRLDWKR